MNIRLLLLLDYVSYYATMQWWVNAIVHSICVHKHYIWQTYTSHLMHACICIQCTLSKCFSSLHTKLFSMTWIICSLSRSSWALCDNVFRIHHQLQMKLLLHFHTMQKRTFLHYIHTYIFIYIYDPLSSLMTTLLFFSHLNLWKNSLEKV